jgi:hypothetical protein
MLIDEVSTLRLSQAIDQATAPAFLLGAVAGFTSILTTRLNRVVDRVRSLQGIAEDDMVRSPLLSQGSHLRQRARLLNRAILLAIGSAMTVTFLILLGFIAALGSFPKEIYVGLLFIVACAQFCLSLVFFAIEVRISLPPLEFND